MAPGKGVLAADESAATAKKRFDAIGVECTEDNRRDYRELLFRSKGMANISGVILFDETIRQKAKDGTPLVKVIEAAGTLPGIKVDKGVKPLPFCDGRGDHRRSRRTCASGSPNIVALGARSSPNGARSSISAPRSRATAASTPTRMRSPATRRSARTEDIVPIVEPEVLMDGDHDIDRCADVTEFVLKTLYEQLYYARVKLEGTVLKPNMVVPGKKSAEAGVGSGSRARRPCAC